VEPATLAVGNSKVSPVSVVKFGLPLGLSKKQGEHNAVVVRTDAVKDGGEGRKLNENCQLWESSGLGWGEVWGEGKETYRRSRRRYG